MRCFLCRAILWVMAAAVLYLLLMTPSYAQAVAPITDPIGAIAALAASIPGLGPYVPTIALYLGALGSLCVLVTVLIPAPAAAAPRWWVVAYRIISFMAGNFGHARNAVAPGMQPAVRDAALVSARLAHAAPELATVASVPSTKTVIQPGANQ